MGGIVQRGITEDILSSCVLRKQAMSHSTQALEDFSGITFLTSEQYVNARETRVKRDNSDITKLQNRLELNNPFSNTATVVISLETSITGTGLINCHVSKKIGEKIMAQFVGKQFEYIK